MKFYSEKLDMMFDSPEALLEAEQGASTKSKKRKKAVAEEVSQVVEPAVPTKKELAMAVERADEHLKEAYAHYESAKEAAKDLSKKYLEEVNNILLPAQEAVKNAEQARYQAIRKFNESYGAYQVTYTGARAADEMMKAISNINTKGNKILRDMFWF